MDKFQYTQQNQNANENKRKHDREKSFSPTASQSWIVENIRSIITNKDEDATDELNTTLTSIKTSDLDESQSAEPIHSLAIAQQPKTSALRFPQYAHNYQKPNTCFDSDAENRRACLTETLNQYNDRMLKRALSPEVIHPEAGYSQKAHTHPFSHPYNPHALECNPADFNQQPMFDCNSNRMHNFNEAHLFSDTSVKRKKIVPNAHTSTYHAHMRFDEPKVHDFSFHGQNNLSQASLLNNAFLHTSSRNSSFSSLQANDTLPDASTTPSHLMRILESGLAGHLASNKWASDSNTSFNYGPSNSTLNEDESQILFPLSPFSGDFKSNDFVLGSKAHEAFSFINGKPPKPLSDKSNYLMSQQQQPTHMFHNHQNQGAFYQNNYSQKPHQQNSQYGINLNEPKYNANSNSQKMFKSSSTLFRENKSSQHYVSHSISSDNVSSLRVQDARSSYQSRFSAGSNFDVRANAIDENRFMACVNDTSTCSSDGSSAKETVILHVKNLDYKISADEWKRILSENFKKHCKDVVSVNVVTNADKSLLGVVKLANKDDIRMAISSLHHKKIGYKRLNVNVAFSPNANSPKSKIIALLKSNESTEMPLTRFMELFEIRYNQSITIAELFKLKDVVYISSSKEGQGRTIKLTQKYSQNNLENEVIKPKTI